MHLNKNPAALSHKFNCVSDLRRCPLIFYPQKQRLLLLKSYTHTRSRLPTDRGCVFSSGSLPGKPRSDQAQHPRWRDRPPPIKAQVSQRGDSSDPRALTQTIKAQRISAVHRIRAPHADHKQVARSLDSFCSTILRISSASDLDYIHISTIIHSTAVVWDASQWALVSASANQRRHCHRTVQSCLSRLLHRAYPMLSKMDSQGAANILWAFAKCGLHPDAFVPGVAADLLQKVAANKEPANAQNLGNCVWAVATMQGDKPLSSATRKLIDSLYCQVLVCIAEPGLQASAKPQEVANILWGLATLRYAPNCSLLDRLCAYLVLCVSHPSVKDNVRPQTVSNALWALYQLRYVPQLKQVAVLLTHMSNDNMQTSTQNISNIVYAVAGFGMQELKGGVRALALGVIDDQRSTMQHLCNVAWGLAVLDALTLQVFRTIVDKVSSKSAGGGLRPDQRRQLYQALYQLQSPLSRDPTAHRVWQAAAASLLQCIGRAKRRKPEPYNVDLSNVLEDLGLRYSRDDMLQNTGYTAAVLHSLAGASKPVMVMVTAQTEYANNHPNRLMGPGVSRREVLGRHAELVCIPSEKLNTEYVKATLEALTGLPLHTAFATSAASGPGRETLRMAM